MYPLLKHLFASAMLISSVCLSSYAQAADLSADDAEKVLWDTFTISGYTDLNGESDYADKPENIICAALFGAYDTKMNYNFRQSYNTEQGEPPIPEGTPLFTVNGMALMPDSVATREDFPALFAGLPEHFTAFITREAVELAALRYTGHVVKEHRAPSGNDIVGETKLTNKGYFISIDGLGDIPIDVVLKSTSHEGDTYILTGELIDINAEDDATHATFKLTLYPGDVPGTWKRQYEEFPGK